MKDNNILLHDGMTIEGVHECVLSPKGQLVCMESTHQNFLIAHISSKPKDQFKFTAIPIKVRTIWRKSRQMLFVVNGQYNFLTHR